MEPRTAAGRALLYDPDEGYPEGLEDHMGPDATRWRDSLREHILAIEAEAAGTALDASLIAEALHVGDFETPCPFRKRPLEKCPLLVSHTNRGDIIAAEYARLAGVKRERDTTLSQSDDKIAP